MFSEHEGPREGLAAETAFERLLPSVVSHVVSVEMNTSICHPLHTYCKSSAPERILPIKGLEAVVAFVHTISMCPEA